MIQPTTETGESWRDEFCPDCRGIRKHERDTQDVWRCAYCGHEADPHTARRLTGAESNSRKQAHTATTK